MSWRAAALLVVLAWSALAFGAVYPWGWAPLFVACAVIGVAVLTRRGRSPVDTWLAASLALVVAAIAAQLVPLPTGLIQRISPETDRLLQRYTVGYGAVGHHALSILPASTAVAIAAAAVLSLLLVGLSCTLTRRDSETIAGGLTVLGAVLALVGIVQKAMWNGKIYGFWTPNERGESFGPFVNRNHFAGWMLMALPIAIAYFVGRVATTMPKRRQGFRDLVAWLSTSETNDTILIGFAAILMALALTLTMSRSGILGLLVGLALSAFFLLSGRASRTQRMVSTVFLLAIAALAVWSVGLDRLQLRFSERTPIGLDGRLQIWGDAWHIARQFPVAGTGINTFSVATLHYQTGVLSLHFAEAHNDYLQLLAEGGVLVSVPIAFAIVAFVRVLRRRIHEATDDWPGYWIRTGAIVGIVSVACQEAVDFSLQIPANAVLFVVLLGLAITPPRSPHAPRRS